MHVVGVLNEDECVAALVEVAGDEEAAVDAAVEDELSLLALGAGGDLGELGGEGALLVGALGADHARVDVRVRTAVVALRAAPQVRLQPISDSVNNGLRM